MSRTPRRTRRQKRGPAAPAAADEALRAEDAPSAGAAPGLSLADRRPDSRRDASPSGPEEGRDAARSARLEGSLPIDDEDDLEPAAASALGSEVSAPQPMDDAEAQAAPAAQGAPPRREPVEVPRIAARRRGAPAARQRWRPLLYVGGALLLFGTGAGLSRFVGAGPQRSRGLEAQLEVERAGLWAGVEEASRARDWQRAAERAERLLQLPETPPHPHRRAREALETALDEGRNLLAYDRFLQAAARRAPDAAVLTYNELSANSVYRDLGEARYLEARASFVRLHLDRARGESERLGCRAAQPHIDAVLAVDPEAAGRPDLIALRARCRSPGGAEVALRPVPRGRPVLAALAQPPVAPAPEAARQGARPTGSAGVGPPAAEGSAQGPHGQGPWGGPPGPVGPGALEAVGRRGVTAPHEPPRQLEDAQQAYISGNYRQAIRIAQQHTGRDPTRAWRVIGGAACYLGDAGLIRKTLDHLDDPAQQFVRQVCQRNGISP